ncbi:MAG: hypothetical protein GWP04_07990 [Gammaproteobacteria bacterium]|nr:hypothetical protein [Gammaproteobacteria bacterium]
MAERRSRGLTTVAVTSCLTFVFGYVMAQLVYLAGLAGFGWVEGREPVLSHAAVTFQATGPNLALTGGLLAAFGVGILLLLVYPGPGPHGVARLTVLWTILHLFRTGLQVILAAPFDRMGIGAGIAASVGLPERFLWILAGVAAAAVLGMGMMAAPAFLKFAPRASLLETRGSRVRVMLVVAGVPWLVGGALVAVFMLPDPRLPFGLIASGVIVLGALVSAPIVGVDHQWRPTVPAIPVVPVVLVAILFWLVVFALKPGVAIPPWG